MKKLNKIFIMVLFVSAVAICFSGCVTFGPAFTPFLTTLARAYRSKEVYEGNKYMYAKFASASDCSGDYYVMTIMYCEDSDIVTIDDERWGIL